MVVYDTSTFAGGPRQRSQEVGSTNVTAGTETNGSSVSTSSTRSATVNRSRDAFAAVDAGSAGETAQPTSLHEVDPNIHLEEGGKAANSCVDHDKRQVNCCKSSAKDPEYSTRETATNGVTSKDAEDSSSQDSKENLLLSCNEHGASSRKRPKQQERKFDGSQAERYIQDEPLKLTEHPAPDAPNGAWYSDAFEMNTYDMGALSAEPRSSSTAIIPSEASSPYAGLVNLGATCYLNSLLQTLFMTPEFRRLMYSWKYDSTVEGTHEDSIPFQLQRLFAMMQLSSDHSISTRPLTKSFQWDSSEAFQQHDVQELMRVLFDALERSLRASGHPTPNMINDLFQGQLTDYIESLDEAANESTDDSKLTPPKDHIVKQHYDYFQDLSLVIKPFGANACISSVEAALEEYIKPEVLKKDNAVYFEELDKKLPALKGLRISKSPYLLTLQLKRFELDYMSPTLRRIKINDRVTFPFLLDLNPFVGDKKQRDRDEPSRYSSLAEQLGIAGQNYDRFLNTAYQWIEDRGPHIYELYSVLVHSGSALGGHYYSFIKNMNTGVWHKFNDSHVTSCSVKEVTNTFGDSHNFGSSATAYMLVYRKIVPPGKEALEITGQNEGEKDSHLLSLSHVDLRRLPTQEEVPQHVCDIVREENEEQKRKEEAEKLERQMKTFFVIRGDDKREVRIHEDSTMRDLTQEAWKIFFGESRRDTNAPSLECVRLRDWDVHNSVAKEPLDSPEVLEKPLYRTSFVNYKNLYLEVRPEDGYFDEYESTSLLVKVYHCGKHSERIAGPTTVVLPRESSVACLKRAVARNTEIGFPVSRQRVYKISNSYVWDISVDELVLDFVKVSFASASPLYPVFYVEDADEDVFHCIYSEIAFGTSDCSSGGITSEANEKTGETMGSSSGATVGGPPNALASGKVSSFRRKDNSSLYRRDDEFATTKPHFTFQEFSDAMNNLPDEGFPLYMLPGYLQPLLDFMRGLLDYPAPTDGSRRLEDLDKHMLPKLYCDQLNQITIKYALPDERFADHFLVVDRRSTVGHLREQLSQIAGISVDRLILKKATSYGCQLNEDSATLADERIFRDTSIHIEEGLRLNPGESLLRLCVIDASQSPGTTWFSLNPDKLNTEDISVNEWTPARSLGGWLPCPSNLEYFDEDTCLHSSAEKQDIDSSNDKYPPANKQVLKNLEMRITKKTTTEELRARVHQVLLDDSLISESLPVNCLRLRQDDRGSPGEVFRRGRKVESHHTFTVTSSYEGYCEILNAPEELDSQEVLVNTCWWDKLRGLLTTPREMILPKDIRVADLAPSLALLSGLNEDQIEYAKPFSDPRDNPKRLKYESWRYLAGRMMPTLWLCDGNRLIFADGSVEAPTPNKEETSMFSPWSSTYTPPRKTPEKGLRIWLKDERAQSEGCDKQAQENDCTAAQSAIRAFSAGYGSTVAKKDKTRENATREYLQWQRQYGELEEDEDVELAHNAAALFEDISSDD
eukprot:gb/GECG01009628.1/.p1 GENE.gb/GECG01009628.1/~~gb/GECG01009628.1/.p1  ORF type:complete len:1475 (+),score=227.04 gb/GECG01009628.1/:1-4425(+)